MPVRQDFAPGEFCWIDLSAHDLDAALSWYGDLFGWTHMMMPSPEGAPPYGFLMSGEAVVGGIGQMNDEMKAQGIPPVWNSYVATKDCDATVAKVRELGGTVTFGPEAIPGHGTLAFFLDPQGASFAAWQEAADSQGPGTITEEHGSMSWIELMTRDTEKAREFYGALFGWDYAANQMGDIEYTMIKNAGKDAGGMMPMHGPQFEGVPPHWLVYFDVNDCDAIAAKVAETGGHVMVPPTEIPVGKFAVLRDPQGGSFCVIKVNRDAC